MFTICVLDLACVDHITFVFRTNEIVFMIKTTSLPDVYELYCKDINNNLIPFVHIHH